MPSAEIPLTPATFESARSPRSSHCVFAGPPLHASTMQSAHRTRLSGQRAGVSQTPHGLPLFSFRQRVVITKACAGLVERVAPSVHGKCVHGSKASVFHGGGRRQLVADARTERPRITKPITRAVFEKVCDSVRSFIHESCS